MRGRKESTPPAPPRLARWVLARILPADERARILEELDEFHRRRARRGTAGRFWYWRQVLGYMIERSELRREGSRGWGRDVRWAIRGLARAPGVAVPAVLTIALALGVNAAVFAVVDGLLLAPLPYDRTGELVEIWMEDPGDPDLPRAVSMNAYRRWRDAGPRSLDGVGLFLVYTSTLLGVGDPTDVILGEVQPRLLARLGPDVVIGRSLSSDDPARGTPTLLLAHAFWRTHLGADPGVVGSSLELSGTPHVVVGVAGPGFRLPLDREVAGWTPLAVGLEGKGAAAFFDDVPQFSTMGWRDGLESGAALAPVRDELQALLPEPEEPGAGAAGGAGGLEVQVAGLEGLVRPSGTVLPVLLGAVTLVLILACLNVIQLLLARGVTRGPELWIRVALGAGPGRLGRMVAAEGAALAVAGGLLGAGLAAVLLEVFVALDPGHLPGWADVRLTPRVGAYLLVATAVGALLVGLLTAIRSVGGAAAATLQRRDGGLTRDATRLQRILLAAQTAVTLVILTGMALLVRSWVAVQEVDPGFDAGGVHTARIVLPFDRYRPGDGTVHLRFFERLRKALRDHPAIGRATVATGLPAAPGLDFAQTFQPHDGSRSPEVVSTRTVSPEYFETLGIPVLAGRGLRPGDDRDAEPVVVLNRVAARFLLGVDDPEAAVGRRIEEVPLPSRFLPEGTAPERPPDVYRVVGVVPDVREAGPDAPVEPKLFTPFLQSRPFGRMWVAVRPARAGDTVWEPILTVLHGVDPELPLVDAALLEERVAATVAPRRFNLLLVAGLGGLSLAIAVVGMVGLAAFVASGSRRQVAIRVALGAGSLRALAPALLGPLASVGAGLALGLGGVALAGDAVRVLLFGVTPLDAASVAGAVLFLAGTAAAAMLVPAWRAGKAEPREVLDG